MSAKDYHQLPTFMQEISSQCRDHKKKFELYCSFHASPCCVQCITDEHKKCQDLKPLSDILQQVKASASLQLLEKDLKDVKENLDAVIKYMNTRISTINTQKTKAVEQILSMRRSINDYLHKLEHDILNDLESKHSKLKSNLTTLLQQIEQQASQINQMQSRFTIMTQYATELQMCIGLREIEKTTSQTAKYMEDLERGHNFIEKNLKVNISSVLQLILHDVKSFGDKAQRLIVKVPGIEEIRPTLLTRLTIPKDMKTLNIFACRVLVGNTFLILDNINKQLLLFSNGGVFTRIVITFTQYPHEACSVRNTSVAVAFGLSKQIRLVDIEKNKIIQTIKLSHDCFGVASDGNTLVISNGGSQITSIYLNDMSHTILEGMKEMCSISLFQGNIYGTIAHQNNVCCFNSTGELQWIFHHQDIRQQWHYLYSFSKKQQNCCNITRW